MAAAQPGPEPLLGLGPGGGQVGRAGGQRGLLLSACHCVRYNFAADILPRMADPLSEPTILILAALAGGQLHGYGIIREVAGLSGGRLSLRPGTLYGALDRLSEQGLVGADGEEVVDGRLRRYYRLTEPGAGVLAAETARMRQVADAADRRLAQRAAGPAPTVQGERARLGTTGAKPAGPGARGIGGRRGWPAGASRRGPVAGPAGGLA
jgi:DNA-binding PadR family transcriptional regulator